MLKSLKTHVTFSMIPNGLVYDILLHHTDCRQSRCLLYKAICSKRDLIHLRGRPQEKLPFIFREQCEIKRHRMACNATHIYIIYMYICSLTTTKIQLLFEQSQNEWVIKLHEAYILHRGHSHFSRKCYGFVGLDFICSRPLARPMCVPVCFISQHNDADWITQLLLHFHKYTHKYNIRKNIFDSQKSMRTNKWVGAL